jgi:uncharacterized membrane protein YvlD (DUF360 family)
MAALLIAWATASLGLWLSARLLDGVRLASFGDAIWAGALLGVLQWALKWPLLAILGIGTFGLAIVFYYFITRWVISAIVILITAKVSSRLDVDGFWNALFTAFIVAVTGSVLQWLA